jgi:type II secretory pathway pseudopilin PulG
MSRRKSSRSGFALLECVIVLIIIVLSAALFLPATRSGRQAARRTQCKNNLKQIGLALHNYLDNFQVFPPGYVSGPIGTESSAPIVDGPSGFAWQSSILPYLDQGPQYNRINFNIPSWDPRQQPTVSASLSVYLCPSASNRESSVLLRRHDLGEPVTYGRSHYVGNAGKVAPWLLSRPAEDWNEVASGILFRNSAICVKDIHAGTSNTVMVGEASVGANRTWAGIIPGVLSCLPSQELTDGSNCDAAATYVLFTSGTKETGGIRTPNASPRTVNQLASEHQGITHALLGDGAVRAVADKIAPDLWSRLCDRNDPGSKQNADW